MNVRQFLAYGCIIYGLILSFYYEFISIVREDIIINFLFGMVFTSLGISMLLLDELIRLKNQLKSMGVK